MKNKYLLSLLAALGFSGCSNNNVWDEPCYYGPGPVRTAYNTYNKEVL